MPGGGNFSKKAPSCFSFSFVSGGKISMGHGSPLNQSGMKTLNFSLSCELERMSAPWRVWGK